MNSEHCLWCSDFLAVEQSPKHHVLCEGPKDCFQNALVETVGAKFLHVLGHAGFSIGFLVEAGDRVYFRTVYNVLLSLYYETSFF